MSEKKKKACKTNALEAAPEPKSVWLIITMASPGIGHTLKD